MTFDVPVILYALIFTIIAIIAASSLLAKKSAPKKEPHEESSDRKVTESREEETEDKIPPAPEKTEEKIPPAPEKTEEKIPPAPVKTEEKIPPAPEKSELVQKTPVQTAVDTDLKNEPPVPVVPVIEEIGVVEGTSTVEPEIISVKQTPIHAAIKSNLVPKDVAEPSPIEVPTLLTPEQELSTPIPKTVAGLVEDLLVEPVPEVAILKPVPEQQSLKHVIAPEPEAVLAPESETKSIPAPESSPVPEPKTPESVPNWESAPEPKTVPASKSVSIPEAEPASVHECAPTPESESAPSAESESASAPESSRPEENLPDTLELNDVAAASQVDKDKTPEVLSDMKRTTKFEGRMTKDEMEEEQRAAE